MRKTYLLPLLCCLSIVTQSVKAQVTGTKTIGVDYTSVAAAITALNTTGMSGNVTINVPAGYTETAPTGGYKLGSSVLNAAASATSTLTFQKSGTGANPLLTAAVGTSTSTDGIFIIQGTDYVTVNRIDLTESGSNTTATTQMEWGYALVKRQNSSPFDGCQNVTIQNCSITLNKANTTSVGIYAGNHIATSTTALTITATTDAMNNCTFSGNTVSNVNRCVSLSGFTSAASPYTLYDQNNSVGGASSNNGNSLTNFGGTATAGYGIYLAGQNNALAGYNTITSASTPGTANVYGVFHGLGNNSSFTVANNTFQLTQGASGTMCAIANGSGAASTGISGSTASLVISGNTFQNFSFTAANSTIQQLCLYNYAGTTTSGWDLGSLKVLGNTVKNFSLNGTGTHYFFYSYYANCNDVRFNDNKITRNRRTSTSGSTYIYYNYYGSPTGGADSVVRNKISENYAPGYIYAVYDYMSSATTTRDRVVMYDTLMYDTTAAATTGYLYGLYTYGGKDVLMANNYVANNYINPSNTGYLYGTAVNYGNNVTIRDNIYDNNTCYGQYCVYEANSYINADVYNNTVTNSSGSTGTNYNIYSAGDGTENIYNNTVANCSITGTGGWYGIYHSSGVTSNIHDNTIYNISANGGTLYGIYSLGGTTVNYYNNSVGKLTNASTSGGNVAGLYATSGTTVNFYDNIIDTVTTAYSSGTAYGVYESGPTNLNCYRNKISYIASFGASGSVNGIYLNSGTTNVYNNLIGNLQLTTSSSTSGTNLVGIYCGVANATNGHTLSYNTVVLNATTSGTAYSSSALFTNTTYPLKLNNNIFINKSQQLGTGIVSAYRRSNTTISSYNTASNNNLFYAGTPGTYNAILYDGTTNYSSLSTYKTAVTPADISSVTGNPTFQSLTGIGTNFLRPSLTMSTQIESNGANITGITDDIYQTTRAGNTGYSGTGAAPDLGAVEDNYIPLDLSAPAIIYTPLPVTCVTGNRTFTATVSDISGVAVGPLAPRVYYKKGTGSWYSSQGTLSSGTTTNGVWTFTIVATDMGGLAIGDVISYYVIAQDSETVSNIGSYPAGVAATDVNTITTHPSTPNTYMVAPSLSGTYNIGVGQTYTTITSAIDDYNNFCLSGHVVFQLMDATYPGETFPITINGNAYASSSATLTIRPAAGVSPVITGSAAAIFKLNGADYVTIDGSNAGTTSRNLAITNTTTTATGTTVLWIASASASDGATNNTIKNCNISGNSSTTTEMCIFSGGTSGTGAFNAGYNALTENSNNIIRNNSFMKSVYGVWLKGNSTSALDQDNHVDSNSFGTSTTGEGFNAGGLVLNFQNNAVASKNDIQNVVGTGGVINATSPTGTVFTGLYVRQCTNATVSGNKVHRMTLNTTANRVHMLYVESPSFNTSTSPSNNLIVNNFVYDGHAAASGATTWTISGISANSGYGDKFYYNTVNLTGAVNISSGPAAAFSNGNALTTVVTSNIDVRNNVFVINGNSTGTSASFFATYWRTAAGVSSSLTDYNDLRSVISSGGTAYTGYDGANRSTLADWQASTSQDANSIAFTPVFVAFDDLHLQPISGNLPLAAGTSITGITTDIDGNTRNATTPVMGAHEVNFSTIPPTITYTAIPDACSTGNRTVTATISDINTGVPTSGTLVPRIYYRKGTGTWYSQPGTLTSGTGSSGTWSFTIVSSDMAPLAIGNVVSYYIIAQTNAGYIGSIPSAGLVATNVNSVSTAPTTPNTYELLPTLNGTYTVGTGGSYATITDAVNAYNNTCLGGPVVFELIDPTYSTGETFPIIINNHPMAGPGTTLTIRPAAGVAASVTSASGPAVFKLLNARYVTLDGVNTGGRSLSLTNNNTGTGTACVWLASTATTGPGNNNVSILNLNLTGGATNTTNWGIVAGVDGASPAATNGMDNDNITIQGNTIEKSGYAIMAMGVPTTNTLDGWVIKNNILGPSSYSSTNNLGYNGVFLRNMTNTVVSGNTLQNIGFTTLASQTVGIYMETNVDGIVIDSNTVDSVLMVGTQTGTSSVCGFYLGGNVKNVTISRNKLSSIYNLNATGYGARGITVNNATAASNVNIVNNFISDITTYSDATVTNDWPIGIGVDGTSGGVSIYHNTINLYGPHPGVTTASGSTDIFIAATGGNIDVRNNLLVNSYDNTSSTTDRTYAIYSTAANTVYSNVDYNDYYTSGGVAILGYVGSTDRTTLAAMVTGFGGNTHSISSAPLFISSADLHLQPFGTNLPLVAGTPLTAVPVDIDGNTRSTTTPVIGANEVNIPPCSGTPTPGVVTATVLSGCTNFNSNLALSGSSVGAGLSLQWQSSTDSSSWTSITGETDINYTPTVTATTYYRVMITCALSSSSDVTPGVRIVSYPYPTITGSSITCVGGSVTLSATPAGGTWTSESTSTATIDPTTGIATGAAIGTAPVNYTSADGCTTSAVVPVVSAPSTPVITPATAVICEGSTTSLSAVATYSGTATLSSATGSITVPGANAAGYSSPLSVILPPGAVITGASVQFNITTTYVGDLTVNLSAPNGNTLNLFNRHGTSGDNFVNTIVSSTGSTTFASSSAPYTGTYAATAATGSLGVTAFPVNVTTWTDLYSTPNGNWNLSVRDFVTSDATAFNSWSITLSYTAPSTDITWAPLGTLYTAVDVTTPYTGGIAPTVYAMPSAPGTVATVNTYTATASVPGCSVSSSANAVVTVNPMPSPFVGSNAVCHGLTTTLSEPDAGGTWISGNTAMATIGATSGVVDGVSPGTAAISYTFTGTGCTRTVVMTVNALPDPITGTATVCQAATTTLADASATGTWTSDAPSIANINASTGVVTGGAAGLAMISYILPTTCMQTKEVTVNPLPVLNISPATSATICEGESAAFVASSPLIEFPVLSQDFNNPTLGAWTITNTAGDAANVWQVTATPFSTTTGDGTSMLESAPSAGSTSAVQTILTSPGFSTVGFGSAVLTFNEYLYSIVGSDIKVAVEYSIDNGTTWNMLLDQIGAIVDPATWSASTPQISLALPSAALNVPNVKLRWNYDSYGVSWAIDNIYVKGALPAATFTWAGVGTADGLSCTACATSTITPTVPGANVYSITASSTCSTTGSVTINVNPLPTITGNAALLCTGKSITLSSSIPGGTWTGSNPAVATVDAGTGIVSGITPGSIVVTYTTPATACVKMVTVNVSLAPQGIAGSLSVCQGFTTTLSNTVSGGTWSSSNTTVATIDAASGVLSGLTIGSAQISYVMPSGCFVRATSNVRPIPNITGSSSLLCTGSSITLSGTIAGGTWSSSDNAVATVDPVTGVVSGAAVGTVVISYVLPTSCGNAVTLNVNQSPGAISGTLHICEGLTSALGNTELSGSWSSSDLGVVSIDITSGLATAVSPGTSTITYTLPSGCRVTDVTIVDQAPTAFTGGLAVCEGLTTTLGTMPTGGTWVSGAPVVAGVDLNTGVVTGIAFGTANITYTSTAGCQRIEIATVNALPVNITGTVSVCQGLTTTLVNTTGGGTWGSSDLTTATIDAGGVVSGLMPGTAIVSYTLSATGCYKTVEVTVNALPDPVPGPITVCEGLTTTLSNTSVGGTWTSGNLTVATINAATGVMSGSIFGTTNITYTLPTGCISTAVATVNPLPVTTTGTLQVCVGLTSNLVNTTGGGTWFSDNTLVAGIDATGMVTGNTIGTANILYTLPTGCLNSVVVTVNPLPAPVAGIFDVCEGLTTSLANATADGIWTSSAPATASVDLLTGVVTGVASGSATITYALMTGCMSVADVTVNALPAAITGIMNVCAGSATTLFNITSDGTWSNDLSGNATVAPTGIVTGVVGGTAAITYTLGTGCMRATEVTVNALPTAYTVTGGGGYCAGTSGAVVGLAHSDLNVNYDLYQGSIFMGSAIGTGSAISFGSQSVVGAYTVFATSAITSCANDMTGSVTVSITPLNMPAVTLNTAATTVCSGVAITYTATPVNGGTLPVYIWEINGSPVSGATSATYNYIPSTGDIVKVTLSSNEICAIPSTATDMLTMTVNTSEMPVATISTPNLNVCAGSGATFSVVPGFGGATPSYEWFVNNTPTSATGAAYTYAPNNGDIVTCKMASSFTCRLADTVSSNNLTITTTPIVLPIVSLSVSPSAVFLHGTTVTFTATVSGVGGATPSYKWLVNGVLQAGATGATFTSDSLNNNDSVTCKVNVSVPCGFENFNSIVVKVKQVGVSQVFGAGNIMLVPNPNQGEFTVKGTVASESDEAVFVEVVDMLGQIVYKGHTATKNGALNERIKLSNTLANGMYMLNLRTATETAVFHFVLEQ